MSQILVPDGDLNVGTWVEVGAGALYYDKIDEHPATDDSDYIYGGTDTGKCKMSLSSGTDPGSNNGWTANVRAEKYDNGNSQRLWVYVYAGSNLIEKLNTGILSTSKVNYSLAISPSEIARVIADYGPIDYADLRIWFEAIDRTIGDNAVYIYKAWLDIPTPTLNVTPTPASAKTNIGTVTFSSGGGGAGDLLLTPTASSARVTTKLFGSADFDDLDGMFSFLAQNYSYTNTSRLARDIVGSVDLVYDVVHWIYPTSYLGTTNYQLPRVMMTYDTKSGLFGLGYPVPKDQLGTHTPFLSRNVMWITNTSYTPADTTRDMLWGLIMIGNPTADGDETGSNDSEVAAKVLCTVRNKMFYGVNDGALKAQICTKVFRPDEDKKTKIRSVAPIMEYGYVDSLTKLNARLWTFNEAVFDDNTITTSGYKNSSLTLSNGTILFDDSDFGVEHAIMLEINTNNDKPDIPPSSYITTSGILGFIITYDTQESDPQ